MVSHRNLLTFNIYLKISSVYKLQVADNKFGMRGHRALLLAPYQSLLLLYIPFFSRKLSHSIFLKQKRNSLAFYKKNTLTASS